MDYFLHILSKFITYKLTCNWITRKTFLTDYGQLLYSLLYFHALLRPYTKQPPLLLYGIFTFLS